MAFFAKLLFRKMDALTFQVAANYVKMIAFGAALDASRKKKLPVESGELVQWSNEWLGPDFIVIQKKKTVTLFDQKHNRQWLDQPVQTFYDTLLRNSYLSIVLRKLKRGEVATIEKMAKAFSREIEAYLIDNPDGEKLASADSDLPRFDSTSILWNLWLEAAE